MKKENVTPILTDSNSNILPTIHFTNFLPISTQRVQSPSYPLMNFR